MLYRELLLVCSGVSDCETVQISTYAGGAGFGFYIYLTWLELFVIEAICQWCVASSLVTVGLLITESLKVRHMLTLPES